MAGLTADQIVERIANANGVEPAVIRQQIEQVVQNIIVDPTESYSLILAKLFPGGRPTMDELVVALEDTLYDAMENFFGRLKVEMFYGEQFESVEDFIQALEEYIYYYNNERISLKLKGMSPVQYRTHSQVS